MSIDPISSISSVSASRQVDPRFTPLFLNSDGKRQPQHRVSDSRHEKRANPHSGTDPQHDQLPTPEEAEREGGLDLKV